MGITDSKLQHATITRQVDPTDGATCRYRWAENEVDGNDAIDEDVSDWSDRELIEQFALTIGAVGQEDVFVVE